MHWDSRRGMTTNLGGAQYRRRALTALVVGGLLLAPAAVWALPQRLPTAQEETSGTAIRGNQVIAQGITRLPKGDLAWTIGRLDVPGEAGTTVDAFPVGFALADGASVAVLDDAGEVLNILDDGEASFLPNGKAGALASWRDDTAGVYEVALLSAGDAAASETPVTVVGNPFAAPNGRAFEIELARAAVSAGEEVTIPVSRSGAPTLFLQTAGTTQLAPPGGEPVELAAGQYALLLGEVIVRGVGDTPATFVAAAIGDTTGERDAAASGTPKAKAGKEDKQRAREGGGSGGGSASGAKPAKEKKAKGQRSGGGGTGGGGGGTGGGGGGRGGGQAQQQQPGGTGNAPVTGGVEEPPAAGTPAAETPQETVPASPSAPVETGEGTPAPEATTPEDENTIVESGAVGTPAEELPAGEGVVEGEELPTEETPPEETLPIEEAPAAEVPTEAAPAEEAPVEGEPTVDPNATG